jgi:hypothetical protein
MAVNDIVMGAAGASGPATYIEDVFSIYLYTGNGSTQTITNGIDLSGKGGLVWAKARSSTFGHALFDTVRGSSSGNSRRLISNSTISARTTNEDWLTFNANGFTANNDPGGGIITANGTTYASWTFRKQPKFFDIVTYTGDGTFGRYITHSFGSKPGFVVVKPISSSGDWKATVNPGDYHLLLNSTTEHNSTLALSGGYINNVSTTVFKLNDQGGSVSAVNASGVTYIAYLFAHDAGGFGLSGTENVISCGSYTGNGAAIGSLVSLGYEPQWLLLKSATDATDWRIVDNMRGIAMNDIDNVLVPNTDVAETNSNTCNLDASGFYPAGPNYNSSGATYIYIAIRRPMKTPTTGTEVFGISARSGTGANATVTGGSLPGDLAIIKNRASAQLPLWTSRLIGARYLNSSATSAEVAAGITILQANPWDVMNGVKVGTTSAITNASSNTFVNYLFTRAPGFFDVVCYTGTGVARTVAHNLAVVPELMIMKQRSGPSNWIVYNSTLGALKTIDLNQTDAVKNEGSINWNSTAPTSQVFTVTGSNLNDLNQTQIAYLFATCAGVSKVGSYTGNGSSQTINCGFTTGARFVMIKRTDSIGNWIVFDTARGIVSANDPYLVFNSTVAEDYAGSFDSIDPNSSGFIVNNTDWQLNVSGSTYIYLAIA